MVERGWSPWWFVAVVGCGPSAAGTSGDEGTTSLDATTSTSGATSASTSVATTIDPGTTTTTTSAGSSDDGLDEESSAGTRTDVGGCPAPVCPGYGGVLGCTDGEDNDGDGFVDLEDPECVGVCDDDESAFPSGLVEGNLDCRRDCAFDGNSGQGDDTCQYDLRCDEESPGELVGCAYLPMSDNCPDEPPAPAAMCIEFCTPFVPPGCDCYGCCTFETNDGPVDVWLDSSSNCSLDDLDGCQGCTSRIEECGNPCDFAGCERCLGRPLADGCATNVCDGGNACAAQDDCACGEVCQLGCCLPLPPG